MAPEMIIEELSGAPAGSVATMEALKGKVVVLEFWATWCAPCIAAFPHLNELVDHYEDSDDVVFIAITNESRETAARVLDKRDLNTWHGFDTDGSVWESYGVNAIPRTIIIGKDGRVAADTYPTMISTDSIDKIRLGKDAKLLSIPDMVGGDAGEPGEMPEMPEMPQTIAEMNRMQMQATQPGIEHERLEALAGTWDATISMSPAGPMGPKIESEVTVTREWIQGGRVLFETSRVEGEAGVVQHSYYGFDREKGGYYLCEISPLNPEPIVWSGQWDEESSSIKFTRTMEIQLMMPGPGQEDDGESESKKLDMVFLVDLSKPDSYETRNSMDLSSLGMGGTQEMGRTVATRSKD